MKFASNIARIRLIQRMEAWQSTLTHDWSRVGADLKAAAANRGVFVTGLFAAAVWFPVVAFNMIILAQVNELFLPGTDPVVLPYFGAVQPLALVMAVIIAAVQSIGAAAAFESETPRGLRWVAALACVILIVYEGWGAYLKGIILDDGGSSGALVSLSQQSGIVSTLIGLAAPLGEELASALAFSVLKPLGLTLFRLPRMLHHSAALSLHRLLYGAALDEAFVAPLIVSAKRSAGTISAASSNIAAAAQRLARDAARVPQDSEAVKDSITAARELRDEYARTLHERLTSPVLAVKLPDVPSPLAAPSTIQTCATHCLQQSQKIEVQVLKPILMATQNTLTTLKRIRPFEAADLEKTLQNVLDGAGALHRLNQQWDAQMTARSTLLSSLQDVLVGPDYTGLAERDQQAYVTAVREALVTLDAECPDADAALSLDELHQQTLELIQARVRALPAASPVGKAGAEIDAAQQAVDRAQATLTPQQVLALNREASRFDEIQQDIAWRSETAITEVRTWMARWRQRAAQAQALLPPPPEPPRSFFRKILDAVFGARRSERPQRALPPIDPQLHGRPSDADRPLPPPDAPRTRPGGDRDDHPADRVSP